MDKVRMGIVGMGSMGQVHAKNLLDGKVPDIELTAISDANVDSLKKFPTLKTFTDANEMMRSGHIDAILIATPHFFHTSLGIAALEAGLHVLVEKPISVHKLDCERLLAAHKNPKQIFAAMFNQRTNPKYLKVKQLIDRGDLGALIRVNWIITDWFRTDAYYSNGKWRATWKGEGGGVLLNQCPHQLDLLQWLCGMPVRVRGFATLGARHDIEVEDQVTAYMEYKNGATGLFVTSTGEAPGTNRLEIVGENGKVVVENGKVHFSRNEVSASEFCKTAKGAFDVPDVWEVDFPLTGEGPQHIGILQNFAAAILRGEKLLSPAQEGIRSVELANSILYSSLTNQTIELPLNADAYAKKLEDLMAHSRFDQKKDIRVEQDMSKSF